MSRNLSYAAPNIIRYLWKGHQCFQTPEYQASLVPRTARAPAPHLMRTPHAAALSKIQAPSRDHASFQAPQGESCCEIALSRASSARYQCVKPQMFHGKYFQLSRSARHTTARVMPPRIIFSISLSHPKYVVTQLHSTPLAP